MSQAFYTPAVIATDTNEGPIIATAQDLFATPSLPPFELESSLSGQFWGSQAYVQPVSPISIAVIPPQKVSFNPCSCVSFVKSKRPDQSEPWGSPNKVEAYDITPFAGLIVITTEGVVGHAAYISSVSEDSLFVTEANYESCRVTTRTIPIASQLIRGFR